MKNLYDLLEISSAASDEVIKAAYRVLSNRYHPDKNIGSESATQAMSAINHAYGVLSDPAQRSAYDASLAADSRKFRESRASANAVETPPQAKPGRVGKTASFGTARSHKSRAFYFGVGGALLLITALIYALAPSGPTGDKALNTFKEPPDPYQLRLNKGEALLSGNGSTQNFLQAKEEFEAIANAKDLVDAKGYRGRAAQKLGEIYASGAGVPKDAAKAKEWFRKAAEYGRVVGPAPAIAVARFYEEGANDKPDFVEAYRWYNLAAGTQFDIDKTMIERDAYDQMISLAKKKREELGVRLTMQELNSAQLSPFPPCRSFYC